MRRIGSHIVALSAATCSRPVYRPGGWRFACAMISGGFLSQENQPGQGLSKTGITGGGPNPPPNRQEGPDGPTKLSKHKVFASIARAPSAIGRARVREVAIVVMTRIA